MLAPQKTKQATGSNLSLQNIYNQVDADAQHLQNLINGMDSQLQSKGLFILGQAQTWMQEASNEAEAQMLFGEFWYSGELCILFADTNLGKSILAVQIGDSISRGKSINPLKLQAPAQTVIYLDFELSKKQFQLRYQNDEGEAYAWSAAFLRAEIDPDNVPMAEYSFEDYLNLSLEQAIEDSGATVLIVDNLTYLKTETERAKDALPLMKQLKQLKSKYKLSILTLAHTPKRDAAKPITRNDLQGSKMLINFCDSAFAIGESMKDRNLRYLKQIKQRNTRELYGADNVCLFQIAKPDRFLHYEFIDYGKEWEHLKDQNETDRDLLKEKVMQLHTQGKSVREIAATVQLSKSTVDRWLKS